MSNSPITNKILVTENCPYCERVEIFLKYRNADVKFTVSMEADYDEYPALANPDGGFLYESIEIIRAIEERYLDGVEYFFDSYKWENIIQLWRESFSKKIDISQFESLITEFSRSLCINALSASAIYPHLVRFSYTKNYSQAYMAVFKTDISNKIEQFFESSIDYRSKIVRKNVFISPLIQEPPLKKGEFYGFDTANERVYLDTAATAQCMKKPVEKRNSYLKIYASTHSTTSLYSKTLNNEIVNARETILNFLGLPKEKYAVLFIGQGATSVSNYLANLLKKSNELNSYAVSIYEHHSNDLPYRIAGKIIHIPKRLSANATDKNLVSELLENIKKGLVTHFVTTSCSNVTGHHPPIDELSEICNENDVPFFLDISQSIAHSNLGLSKLKRLDGVYFSGHKIYAPGTPGVLVIDRNILRDSHPPIIGGGAVEDVSKYDYILSESVETKHQPGTLDVLGIIQLKETLKILENTGMDRIYAHEKTLTEYTYEKLSAISNIVIYGYTGKSVGLIAFNIIGMEHELVAEILYEEYGIEVRNACFCAHPYVRELLRIDTISRNDFHYEYSGMVRISFGAYNTKDDADKVCSAIAEIAQKYLEQK
ncbi:MAG: aminotransferase class V-fold PLP-dependent enzyme [Ectothiorhodospiraceae bacterium]|nr:aminotransferase class V-fold PLP-dependent enzyme [Ectothiorhodospiraceae bacterium]